MEGDKLIKKMDKCVMQGINQTMSAASIHAKQNHPWRNRTGTLEGSIRPVVAAHKVGSEFVGLWGSVDVAYALVLELGSFGRVGIPPYPYLRPAADAEYPKLAQRIRDCFEGRGGIEAHRESVTLRSGRTIEVLRPTL